MLAVFTRRSAGCAGRAFQLRQTVWWSTVEHIRVGRGCPAGQSVPSFSRGVRVTTAGLTLPVAAVKSSGTTRKYGEGGVDRPAVSPPAESVCTVDLISAACPGCTSAGFEAIVRISQGA